MLEIPRVIIVAAALFLFTIVAVALFLFGYFRGAYRFGAIRAGSFRHALFLFGYFRGAYSTLRAIEKARAGRRGKEPHA